MTRTGYLEKKTPIKELTIIDILDRLVKGKYTITNGVCDVKGSVKIDSFSTGFTRKIIMDIPIKFGHVSGNFEVVPVLYSLKNCPVSVGGDLTIRGPYGDCISNDGLPVFMGGSINIGNIQLPDLTALPRYVDGRLNLNNTNTKTLAGGPKIVTGLIALASMDELTSLEGFPQSETTVNIYDAKNLTSLKGIENNQCSEIILNQTGITTVDYLPRNAHIVGIQRCENLVDVEFNKHYKRITIGSCSNIESISIKSADTVLIDSCASLTSIDGIEFINGDLMIFNCTNLTDRSLLMAGIGDKVKGEISVNYRPIDKKKYSKRWREILTDDETGLDLTF